MKNEEVNNVNVTLTDNQFEEIKKLEIMKMRGFFTLNELSEYLGCNKQHIYSLISNRGLPCHKSKGGKTLYFKKDEIDEWCLGK